MGYCPPRVIPALLIFGAVACSAAVAFGCDPALVEWPNGLAILRLMYRLQWACIGLTVAFGLGLAGLVAAGGRRGWWLIGLLPVVALFGWRFGVAPARPGAVDDQPTFVQQSQAGWLADDDGVIGVLADDQPYAFPLAAMRHAPVVVHTEREKRLLVTWSAPSGVASAAWVDRTVRGRDLRIVSSPRGVILLFNARLGEFFDGLTLGQSGGGPFQGFQRRVAAEVTTWGQWKSNHPATLTLLPRHTIEPADAKIGRSPGEKVIFIASEPPIVLPAEEIGVEPVNSVNGGATALVFRRAGRVTALDRRVDADLFPRFTLNSDPARRNVAFIDSDSGGGWSWSGECVEGPLKGTRLNRLIVIEDVPAEAARFWLSR